MNKMDPLVSVVLLTYNTDDDYLIEAVKSILNQTYRNLELIIINDGSDSLVGPVLADIVDKRVRIIEHEENRKCCQCMNEAIGLAQGSFIAKMDADDISHPERIQKQVRVFLNNDNIQVLGTSIEYIGAKSGIRHPNLSPTREEQQVDMLFSNAGIAHPSFMVRKSFWDTNHLKYSEAFGAGAEDYQLWTQITSMHKIDCIYEPLLKYRIHVKQMTQEYQTIQKILTEQVRWNQLKEIQILPTENQKNIHRKFCSKTPFIKEEWKEAKQWIDLLMRQNSRYRYFDENALKAQLYYRMAAIGKESFVSTKDIMILPLIIKYATGKNWKNWFGRLRRRKEKAG